jgi:hypothetical protein
MIPTPTKFKAGSQAAMWNVERGTLNERVVGLFPPLFVNKMLEPNVDEVRFTNGRLYQRAL